MHSDTAPDAVRNATPGDDSTKPTYFEAIAADKLVPSLKAALVYSLSVFSQRHSWVHRVLDYEDEVVALALLLADWHALASFDATFAENLYGLRRRRAQAVGTSPSQSHSGTDILSRKQKAMSLLLEVLLPYIRSKAERKHQQLNQGVLGLALQRGTASLASIPWSEMQSAPWRTRLKHLAVKCFVAAYPSVHAVCEGTSLAYHLAYMSGAAVCHRPVLHGLGLQLARVSAQDLSRLKQQQSTSRASALSATQVPGRPALIQAAHRGLLRTSFFASDYSRYVLILAVFGFKALEWWFTSAEERLAAGKTLPTPPPPPPPLPAQQGVGLPQDPSCCPVCKQALVNPAQVATSGYVGCYQCVHQFVSQHACCPVTRFPTSIQHIRKLYDAA